MSDGSGKKCDGGSLLQKFGNVHRHYVGFTPRIDKGHFLVRFGVIDIVNWRDDYSLIFHQINGVILTRYRRGRRAAGLLLLPGRFQFFAASR